jgi:hypothetical protein
VQTRAREGCQFDPSLVPPPPLSDEGRSAGDGPATLPLLASAAQLAQILGTDLGTLQRMNPGQSLQPDTCVATSAIPTIATSNTKIAPEDESNGGSAGQQQQQQQRPLTIPCPGSSSLSGQRR